MNIIERGKSRDEECRVEIGNDLISVQGGMKSMPPLDPQSIAATFWYDSNLHSDFILRTILSSAGCLVVAPLPSPIASPASRCGLPGLNWPPHDRGNESGSSSPLLGGTTLQRIRVLRLEIISNHTKISISTLILSLSLSLSPLQQKSTS